MKTRKEILTNGQRLLAEMKDLSAAAVGAAVQDKDNKNAEQAYIDAWKAQKALERAIARMKAAGYEKEEAQ